VQTDRLAGIREAGADLAMHTSDRGRDGDRLGSSDELLDERSSASTTCAAGAKDAVQELADRDDADRPVLVADQFLDRPSGPLVLDEQVGVDQDGQGSSG
jgi:hypothetical protein